MSSLILVGNRQALAGLGGGLIAGGVAVGGATAVPTPTPVPVPTPTPAAPVVLPPGARYARDLRNGWGVNAPFGTEDSVRTAAALGYLGTRWVRQQFSGDNRSAMTGLQAALVSGGHSDPTLKLQLLLNGYINNAQAMPFTTQASWLLSLLSTTGPSGRSIVAAAEGPNEMNNRYVGNGSRGPNGTTDLTGQGPSGPMGVAPNPTADANFVDWATQLHNLRLAHPEMAGVEILSPTVIYFLGSAFPSDLNVTGLVDYFTYHYYAGSGNGTGGIPSQQGNPGNLSATYSYAQAGILPGGVGVMSEGGASTETGAGYSQQAAAIYHPIALLDFFRLGGHRTMIYCLFDNHNSTPSTPSSYNEDSFGLFWGDATPKMGATVMRNVQNLLSLNMNTDDPANLSDTANFVPVFDGSTLTVSGLTNAGTSGSCLVLPKSDKTAIIALWREAPITDNGNFVVASADQISLDLGASYRYRVFDITGGGGAASFTPALSTAPIATGTGRTVQLTMYDGPVFVEVS